MFVFKNCLQTVYSLVMKMDIAHYSGGSDDGVLSSLEWTDDDSIALNEAVFAPLADGKTLIPAGETYSIYFFAHLFLFTFT